MSFHWHPAEQVRIARFLCKWTLLAGLVGVAGGSASALFLFSLDLATETRLAHPWLLYLLPACGLAVGLLYHYWGSSVERGNNLILEEIHNPRAGISGRMAPLILLSTVATHLFGGSAGREGTAVQMGGSLASWFGRTIGLDRFHTRLLLMAGISAGFGSVFGTPLAGMIFGLEVLAVGRMRYDALVPCLVASVVGHWTCLAWNVHHTHYPELIHSVPDVDALLVAKVLLAALLFALASILFAELTHLCHWLAQRWLAWAPVRPVVGGAIIIALAWALGTDEYLGLGVPTIQKSFMPGAIDPWAFWWKILFTAVTLGSGFKGGEVTPLFFIGAALGATLGTLLGVPHDFMASLGFVAVFAAAANTPLACTVMGIELFGAQNAVFLGIACCSAYIWSGHRGIYLSQLVATPKTDSDHLADDTSLHSARQKQPHLVHGLRSLANWLGRWLGRLPGSARPAGNDMAPAQPVQIDIVRLLRIYLPRDRQKPGLSRLQALFARPLHAEIVDLARAAGLSAVTADAPHAGHDPPGDNTQVCVELLGSSAAVEEFYQRILPWLGKDQNLG